jgi:hypothetical protein
MTSAPSTLELLLYYAVIGSQAILLLKLLGTRLFRRYRWLTTYLALEVMQFLLLLPFPANRHSYHWVKQLLLLLPYPLNRASYGWIWVSTEPLLALVQVFIILELYRLVLGGYPGIASLARWAFYAAFSVALAVTILTLWPDLSNASERFRTILYVNVLGRAVYSSAAIFLLLITAFLAWYPVPLNRNIVLFAMAYAPFFLGKAAALFVRNTAGNAVERIVSTIMLMIDVGCLLTWLAFLNPRGEERKVVAGHRWNPGDDERLIAQLDAVNRALLRSARK